MKTLRYIDGNLLLNKEVEVIGHQANCQNTFGSGIARSIREMYPEAYAEDTNCAALKQNVLGNCSVARISALRQKNHGTKIEWIFNLYGQHLYGRGVRQTNYEGLYSALEKMATMLKTGDEFSNRRELTVGFPYLMGSALGGGNWNVVSRLIEVAFDGYNGDVLIVRLKT